MMHSHARLAGQMALTVLDPAGRAVAHHDSANSVVPSGQALLLSALRGNTVTSEIEPFLGTGAFDPGAEKGLEQDGVIRLTFEAQKPRQQGAKLEMGFRCVATGEGVVVGGGLAMHYKQREPSAEGVAIYNFAQTAAPVEIQPDMPLLLTFTLSVG